MERRYTLKYEYSKDGGLTWIDFSDIVDSMQTTLTHNLCTTQFKSTKDSVSMTIPAVTSPIKNQLVEDLLGTADLMFRMNIPTPVPVKWSGNDVYWDSNEVRWRNTAIGFTGYIDRSSVNLKSYPLPTALSLTAYDVSWLNLDKKVNKYITYEDFTITQIVHALLTDAGYSYDASTVNPADDVTLEGFVIDKDDSKTYREYIDTLLFEAGGYVLDFMPNGIARIFRIPWDDANGPLRTIDNPMNESGIQIRSTWLQNDGVKLKWSTLDWKEGAELWRDSINRQWGEIASGKYDIVGEWIKMERFWPDGGELIPSYMEYSAEWLDTPYLLKDTRMQNKDLSVIMAKNVGHVIEATRGGVKYEFPEPIPPATSSAGFPIPTSPTDFTAAPYNFTSNPMAWAKKAWYLLHNPQWSPVTPNGTENPKGEGWYEYSNGTYIKTQDTEVDSYKTYYIGATYTAVTPQGTENPAYEGWFVLSGGNYVLSTDVTVQPGTTYYSATDGWVNLQSFEIQGDVLYRNRINTLETDGSTNPKEYTSTYIYDATQAQNFLNFYWHFLNTSRFSMTWSEPMLDEDLGDVVEITQKGMAYTQDAVIVAKTMKFINDKTPVISYSAVGVAVPVLSNGIANSLVPQGGSGTATYDEVAIEQKVEELEVDVKTWDFDLSSVIYPVNLRDVSNDTHIVAKSKVKGYPSASLEWEARDASGTTIATGSGSTFDFYIPLNNSYASPISVIMSDSNGSIAPLTKTIDAMDETEYDHDFAVWEPLDDGTNIYVLPDHFTVSGVDYDSIKGDYFVSKVTFAPYSSGTAVVSPTGDPSAQGWYERKGSGTNAKPYYWQKTTDTSVAIGKTYGTVGAGKQKFEAGYAYMYSGSSWDGFDITDEASARKAANLLDDLVTGNVQIPESASNFSMWKWAKNFAAQNAIINNLFSQAITILSGGHIKGGSRYDANGNIQNWNADGFWFGANGKLMASLQSDGDGNTYVGTDVAQYNSTHGQYNTAMGYQTMYKNNTSGNYNIAIGYQALYTNATKSNNIAIGYQALYSSYNGMSNVAIGYRALYQTATGSSNIAIGSDAMQKNTSGAANIALGNWALRFSTSASSNIAIGSDALGGNSMSGDANVAIGANALDNNSTGFNNIGLGYSALTTTTSGGENLGIGYEASVYSATGYQQMNLMDSLIYLEFKSSRQNKQIYTALHSYYSSSVGERYVGAMGVFNNEHVVGIDFKASSVVIYGRSSTIATLTNASTITYSGRAMLLFINPNINGTTRHDCLET